MMKYPAVESMTPVTMPDGRKVRIWREEPSHQFSHEAHEEVSREVLALARRQLVTTAGDLAEMIADQVHGVAAVEVLDAQGRGVVVYKVWP